ncbi:MAG: hypothetical protein ACUVWR_08715 [Anaerolineae bacterium]
MNWWRKCKPLARVGIFLLAALLLLCACTTITEGPVITTAPASTTISMPTATSPIAAATAPTDTPTPTPAPVATDTPLPTSTPLPTDTPAPSPTPTLPPQPVLLSGVGQTATDPINLPAPVSVAHFTHSGSSNFVVFVYVGGEKDLLINEIGAYEGARPLFVNQPVFFDIDADGAWTIRIEPIGRTDSPAFSGKGDDVSGLFDPPGTAPWEVMHDGTSNFIVFLHCAGGSDLIQNKIGPVSGSTVVEFPTGPCFWEVEADGNWSLQPR